MKKVKKEGWNPFLYLLGGVTIVLIFLFLPLGRQQAGAIPPPPTGTLQPTATPTGTEEPTCAPTDTPTPKPEIYRVFLSLVTRQEEQPPCSVRKMRISLPALGQKREIEFGPWPGPFYGNITLPYGASLIMETTDGEEIRSSLKWFEGGSWYRYYEPRSEWRFTATFEENTWFNLRPGRAYEFAAWYMNQGQLCNLRVDMQWDPPE